MNKNIFEYIEHLIQHRHILSDLCNGVAIYFIEDITEDGEPVNISIMSAYSHIENGIIFCSYTIDINEQPIISIIAPATIKTKIPEVIAIKKLLSMCSNKIILQELQAQRNGFLRALGNSHERN
ncbi:MAG: hypothetical protein J6R99_04260 [Alphaproteobacteria bacterium]|nr:hypothetical protein [Alphaproteobacteria bacterium]